MDAPVCADQRTVECRADVLVYSTPALTEPITIAGDVSAVLYVSADVEDTDVFVKLVDVYPDGTAYNLADSCLRLRYRDGLDQPEKLVPGEIYRIEITGITTANYFPAGHRLRIEIAGLQLPARRPELARLGTQRPRDRRPGRARHPAPRRGPRVGSGLPRVHGRSDGGHPDGQAARPGGRASQVLAGWIGSARGRQAAGGRGSPVPVTCVG